MGVDYDVSIKALDEDSLIGWNWCTGGLVGFYFFNQPSEPVGLARPALGEGFNRYRLGRVFLKQLIHNGPVYANLGCKGAGHGEYLAVPSRDGSCGIDNGKNVDFSVVCDLFDLPDSPLNNEVESNACLGNHEFFAENADALLAGEVHNQVAPFVGDHAQVFEIVESGPRGAVECVIISLEITHLAQEFDDLLNCAILQVLVWVGSVDDALGS